MEWTCHLKLCMSEQNIFRREKELYKQKRDKYTKEKYITKDRTHKRE